jgi:hypothetical protein
LSLRLIKPFDPSHLCKSPETKEGQYPVTHTEIETFTMGAGPYSMKDILHIGIWFKSVLTEPAICILVAKYQETLL